LSTTAWSLASLSLSHMPLMEAITQRSLRQLREFSPQSLANTAWALAIWGFNDDPLIGAIAEAASLRLPEFEAQGLANLVWRSRAPTVAEGPLWASLSRTMPARLPRLSAQNPANTARDLATATDANGMLLSQTSSEALLHIAGWADDLHPSFDRPELVSKCTCILSLAWALAFANLLEDEVRSRLRQVLLSLAAALDACPGTTALPSEPLPEREGDRKPRRALGIKGMWVIYKPADWEVDGVASDGQEHLPLSSFLRKELGVAGYPIASDAGHGFGFLHRLDIPSSGLVLCGISYAGYYCLRLQLDTQTLQREYFILAHDLPDDLSIIEARIDVAPSPSQRRSVSDIGRPATTHLRTLAHFRDVLFATGIRIATGRRHQIRAHLRFRGHPSVADARYSCRNVCFLLSDPAT